MKRAAQQEAAAREADIANSRLTLRTVAEVNVRQWTEVANRAEEQQRAVGTEVLCDRRTLHYAI